MCYLKINLWQKKLRNVLDLNKKHFVFLFYILADPAFVNNFLQLFSVQTLKAAVILAFYHIFHSI